MNASSSADGADHGTVELAESARRQDEFLALLAHELRNPLSPILHGAELVAADPSDQERARRWALTVRRQALHMARLLDDLLDVACFVRGEMPIRAGEVDLAEAVERAVEMNGPALLAQHHMVCIDVHGGVVQGDPVRVAQMLGNLLDNAAKFSPPGGRIHVRARTAGDQVTLEVEDNGIGLDPVRLDSIFQPFVQNDASPTRRWGGLGIGLALARRIAAAHGGDLKASSPGPGHGARFTAHLRMPPTQHRPAAARPAPVGRRILVVDDNPDVAEALRDVLRRVGHEVELASDGPAALRAVSQATPDVIILDIGMPGMDGREVARRMRSSGVAARLVAVSGYATEDDRRKSHAAGFDLHLAKPPQLAELLAAVN